MANIPEAFSSQLQAQRPHDWQSILNSLATNSPTSLRVNEAKGFPHLYSEKIPWCKSGYYLSERPSFTLDPTFHGGSYYVQEASSMFVEQAFLQSVDQTKALNVLDLCAAPGGKSTHLLSLMNKESLLVSNEVIRTRANILSENIQKWGYSNSVVTTNDPHDFERLKNFFDVMVVDAPCSGEGLFRKDPNAMSEWSPDNVALCSKRQRRILSDVWPALKQGGILIYSTCTYNEAENEENLAWLREEQGVEFISLQLDPSWNVEQTTKDNVMGYRFFPHKVRGEGFFLSVMRKTNGGESRMNYKNSFTAPSKKIIDQLSQWVRTPEEKAFIIRNDQIQFFPKSKNFEIEFLAKNLYLISAGTSMATVKHEKLIPEHALALSIELNKDHFTVLNVELPQALQYLRKETLEVHGEKKGFALIQYNSIPLGWANVLDNRMNNLYPSEWRIRK